MKAGLVLFRVRLNLWRRHQRRLLLCGMLADFLEGFHNPALRLFQPATRLDSSAIFRNLWRTITTLECGFRFHLFLPNFPTGFFKSCISISPVAFCLRQAEGAPPLPAALLFHPAIAHVSSVDYRLRRFFHLRLDVPHDLITQNLQYARHSRMKSAQFFTVAPEQERGMYQRADLHPRQISNFASKESRE